mgnify:CR=1 FL=1
MFPEGFLWERGCNIAKADEVTITTPKQKVFTMQMWGTLPFVYDYELKQILNDLPEPHEHGRGGSIRDCVVARVSRVNADATVTVREQLKHLRKDMPKELLANVSSKYRDLPETYYGGECSKFVTPETLQTISATAVDHVAGLPCEHDNQYFGECRVELWEWYSGSSSLSTRCREKEVPHGPPIDYRYGWNLSKAEHQEKLLNVLVKEEVETLFASPNCSPWGNNSRSGTPDVRKEKRSLETSNLVFLTVACFVQVLLNKKYIIEKTFYKNKRN